MTRGKPQLTVTPNRIRRDVIRKRVREGHENVTDLCARIKIHRDTYYEIINGTGGTRMETLETLCNAIGLTLKEVIDLEPAGTLEPVA